MLHTAHFLSPGQLQLLLGRPTLFLIPTLLRKFKRFTRWCPCLLSYSSWMTQVLSPDMAELCSGYYLTWHDHLISHRYHRKITSAQLQGCFQGIALPSTVNSAGFPAFLCSVLQLSCALWSFRKQTRGCLMYIRDFVKRTGLNWGNGYCMGDSLRGLLPLLSILISVNHSSKKDLNTTNLQRYNVK